MGRVENNTAHVTGAKLTDGGENIGSATARALAREGAAVVVADLDGVAAERLAGVTRRGFPYRLLRRRHQRRALGGADDRIRARASR